MAACSRPQMMQGSMINLVDEKGVGVTAYDYDDYGTTTIIGKQDTANELAYIGGVYDKTTEEYYLNARYYSPEDGRFLSMDTERGENTEYQTWNLYGYCGGDPVNYVDPSGHKQVYAKALSGIGKNRGYLSNKQQVANAKYIKKYLVRKGWKYAPIGGLLGNIWVESKMNPGQWQKWHEMSLGYGLVQWDDASKFVKNPYYVDNLAKKNP